MLIDVASLLDEKIPIMLVFIGTQPMLQQLQEMVVSYDLESRVWDRGALDRNSVYRALHESDIFITSSRIKGIQVEDLEAMNCGCVPNLLAIPSHLEIADASKGVLLIKIYDAEKFTESLLMTLNMNEENIQGLKLITKECARRQYSFRAMHLAYEGIYRSLVRNSGASV